MMTRQRFNTFKKAALIGGFALFAGSEAANAATFTAITSGNFSSSLTWLGGLIPSLMNTGDVVIVPSGITVNLDQNATFNGSGSALTLNGTLTSSTGKALILTNTSLSGSGSINVDSMALSTMNGFTYTGNITAQKMTSTGATIAGAASVTVTGTLRLASGTLSMMSGSSLNLANNATIVVSGGMLSSSGATLGLSNTYNVRYEGGSNMMSGLELTGTGLNNIDVATGSGNGVSLSGDLNIHGMLTLSSGTMRLNNHNLTFSGNGNFSASGSGSIASSSGSNLSFMGSISFTGGVRFRSDSNSVNNLTVNMGSATNSAMLGSSLNVAGTLTLTSGRLDIDSNMLSLTGNSSTSVSGGSSNSYVVTSHGGRLGININAGASAAYHVGTMMYYAPAMLTSNTGNGSGMLSISVADSVRAQGMTGSAWSSSKKAVNATWHVYSANTSNININLTTMWSANMEVNGFNRSQAFISHYTNGSWDLTAGAAATTSANGMFSLSRNNITSLSPFAVYDASALGVKTQSVAGEIRVYPNPASASLRFDAAAHAIKEVSIYNAAGSLVKKVAVTGNSINIEDLQSGVYFANFNDGNAAFVSRFTKN